VKNHEEENYLDRNIEEMNSKNSRLWELSESVKIQKVHNFKNEESNAQDAVEEDEKTMMVEHEAEGRLMILKKKMIEETRLKDGTMSAVNEGACCWILYSRPNYRGRQQVINREGQLKLLISIKSNEIFLLSPFCYYSPPFL
jgi:hypothetical protein